jgi:hypothetical protein
VSIPDGAPTLLGGVPADYTHVAKQVTREAAFVRPDSYLKWYDIACPDAGVPDAVRAEARTYLGDRMDGHELDISGDVGFVVLHRCGESFYFLIVCTWRHQNEMWQTVYARDTAVDAAFAAVPASGHRAVICVWEAAAVMYEHRAWARFLRSDRGPDAALRYLQDQFEGPA